MSSSLPPARILVLGAHPDDAEFHAGGLLTLHSRQGSRVRVVSVTNGAAGHHLMQPEALAARRRCETQAVAQRTGWDYEVWDFPDGELQPTLELRRQVIAAIRSFAPDLVLTHRTCDYHPDHRAVGQAVQDASFMVTVPRILPDVSALRRDPVVAYMNDLFCRPAPLRPDVLLDIGPWVDDITDLLDCHRSQVYEWLPYVQCLEDPVPDDPQARWRWLRDWFTPRPAAIADRHRAALCLRLGTTAGDAVRFAEAYEISEYARPLDAELSSRLFPRGLHAATVA